jgi:hypothetical protein
MNHNRKKAAVEKYKPLLDAGATREEILNAIAGDEKAYTPEEVNEIVAAVYGEDTGNSNGSENSGSQDGPGNSEAPATLNKVYEEYRVEPKYDDVTDQLGKVIGKKLSGFEKVKKIRDTSVTPERAKEVNSQSENSGIHLFEKKD